MVEPAGQERLEGVASETVFPQAGTSSPTALSAERRIQVERGHDLDRNGRGRGRPGDPEQDGRSD